MAGEDWWKAFCQTGRIEDYLRYRGVDIYRQPPAAAAKEPDGHAVSDRRPDPEGKQQYR